MYKKLEAMIRRIKQRNLYEKLFEYIDSKYCTGNKTSQRDWLLEFICHTPAKDPSKIKYADIESFSEYIFKTIHSAYSREDAIKAVRKFLNWCVLKRYMKHLPTHESFRIPTKDDLKAFADKIVGRRERIPKNADFIKKVMSLNEKGLSYQEIANILSKEDGKRYYRGNLCNLVNRWKTVLS